MIALVVLPLTFRVLSPSFDLSYGLIFNQLVFFFNETLLKTMEVITNGCNGSLSLHNGEDERTENSKNVILSSTLPHSENNAKNNNYVGTINGGSINNSSSIKTVKPKRSKKCAALLDDNRYATRIEDMVEEHLKFGRYHL